MIEEIMSRREDNSDALAQTPTHSHTWEIHSRHVMGWKCCEFPHNHTCWCCATSIWI